MYSFFDQDDFGLLFETGSCTGRSLHQEKSCGRNICISRTSLAHFRTSWLSFSIHNIVCSIKLLSCASLYLWSYSVWPGNDVHSFIYVALILSTLPHFHLHFILICQYWDSSCLIDFEINNLLFMMRLILFRLKAAGICPFAFDITRLILKYIVAKIIKWPDKFEHLDI